MKIIIILLSLVIEECKSVSQKWIWMSIFNVLLYFNAYSYDRNISAPLVVKPLIQIKIHKRDTFHN